MARQVLSSKAGSIDRGREFIISRGCQRDVFEARDEGGSSSGKVSALMRVGLDTVKIHHFCWYGIGKEVRDGEGEMKNKKAQGEEDQKACESQWQGEAVKGSRSIPRSNLQWWRKSSYSCFLPGNWAACAQTGYDWT